MAEEKTVGRPVDATGATVRRNIRRLRDDQGISAPELSAALGRLDRPIPPLGISRIESGQRRVDVDDLVAFALALDVSPISLLMPDTSDPDEEVPVTGMDRPVPARQVWDWLRAWETPDRGSRLEFFMRSWPEWFRDHLVEKLETFKERQNEHLQRRRRAKADDARKREARAADRGARGND